MSGPKAKRRKTVDNSLTRWLGKPDSITTTTNPCPSPNSKARQSGIDPEWQKTNPWLIVTQDKKGMLCKFCIKFNMRPKNGSGTWVTHPCNYLVKDSVTSHSKSKNHQQATDLEANSIVASQGQGIQAALDTHTSMETTALIGAFRCMYWLAKEEIAHTTHYPSLLELAKTLGCDYLNLLKKGQNAFFEKCKCEYYILCIIMCYLFLNDFCDFIAVLHKITSRIVTGPNTDGSKSLSGIPVECKKKGAKLAEINTKAELQFVRQLAKKYLRSVWIGGTDAASEGQWKWASGAPITVSDFKPEKLSPFQKKFNRPERQDCLAIVSYLDHHWRDISCIQGIDYMCEKGKLFFK
ncbi:unnamed protein product [Mytilus coruscus]|uniref:C-type lectin domain-containing protein n=1 Tax=Mytilus coruscus TaxID=42192 RepID=A0A6J8AUN7_MYTCO|nr:unnamed protein product [Mytilus coruscus]